MGKLVQISIAPSSSGFGELKIQDAMRQVGDFFGLLSDNNNRHVQWILESVSFNSPLVIKGKPINTQTGQPDQEVTGPIIREVASVFSCVSLRQSPSINLSSQKSEMFKQLLQRNTNGIDKTKYEFGSEIEPVTIDPSLAEFGLTLLDQPSGLDDLLATFPVQGYGSITGLLVQLGTYYNKPAIYVKDFISGKDIWCQVDQLTLDELKEKIRAKDVWERRNVRVEGMLDYDETGKLTHITDGRVSYLTRKEVSLDKLYDPDFAEGLPSEKYLKSLRED